MTPIVDIIGYVVTAMKPAMTTDYTAIVSGGGATVTVSGIGASVMNVLYVGEKIKLTYTGSADVYGTISSIDVIAGEYVITLPSNIKVPPATVSIVLNYHHGHGLEIVNTFIEITKSSSKREQFPAICLLQDFTEGASVSGYEREASLNVIILTDSKQTYKAADRYTYTFKPILYPLYDLFIERLQNSTYLAPDYPEHDKTDRLAWGKSGLYGNTANIFNDFIDAIEIENLKIKIFKTC